MLITDKNDAGFIFCDDYFLYLIDNNIDFDPEDTSMFLECNELKDERTYGELCRWDRPVTSICQIGDRYFQVCWSQGLTEYQEDYFDESHPIEVVLHEYQKTITVKEWKEFNRKENLINAIKCFLDVFSSNHCKNCPYQYNYLDTTSDSSFWTCNEDKILRDALIFLQGDNK